VLSPLKKVKSSRNFDLELVKKFGLLLFTSALSLFLFELGFRGYLAITNSGSLEKQLERSKLESVSNSTLGVSLGGLIRPSKFKDIVYELKPNISVIFQSKPVITNSLGMREKEVEVRKQPKVQRIIGLGDSIMFGWGVEKNETYLNILESLLNTKTPTEVLNFGVPGYNTAMEVALFERNAKSFSPDTIVVQFVNNDFDVPAFMLNQDDPWDFSKSMLLSFVSSRLNNSQLNNSLGKKVGLVTVQSMGNRKNSESQKVLLEYKWMTGEAGATKAFKKLRELAPNTKIVVLTGSKTPVQQRMLNKLSKELNFSLVEIGPVVDRYFRENNLENNKEIRKQLLTVAPNDRHPSPLGHKLIAQALAEAL